MATEARHRAWRRKDARRKTVPVWRKSLFVYIVGSSLVTLAGGLTFAFVEPMWLSAVVWVGGIILFLIVSGIVEAVLRNRRVARLLAEGRPSAARAVIATSHFLTDEEKQERMKAIRLLEADGDTLLPYDPERMVPVPWIGILLFLGTVVFAIVTRPPFLHAANSVLIGTFAGGLIDAGRTWWLSRRQVTKLLRAARYEDAERLARRHEVAALRDFDFPGLFREVGRRRFDSVIEGLPAAPWVPACSLLVAGVSRLAGLPDWLSLVWTMVTLIGTSGIMHGAIRGRIRTALDDLSDRSRHEEAQALRERVEETHRMGLEEE